MVARPAAAFLALWLAAAGAALQVVNADGERVALALGTDERALVVHCWASWCPECGEELPGVERAVRDCGNENGVRVVAVNVGESADVAGRFLKHGSALPLLRDPECYVWRGLARGLPANLIWTREGRRVEVGPRTPSTWADLLASLGCPSMERTR